MIIEEIRDEFTDDPDDFFEPYDPYNGYTYFVSGADSSGRNEIKLTNSPTDAIKYWFRISKKFPHNTDIQTMTKSNAISLVKAGTEEFLTDLYNKYGSPYRLDFLIDECWKQSNNNCSGFYEGMYGDSVYPFDVG